MSGVQEEAEYDPGEEIGKLLEKHKLLFVQKDKEFQKIQAVGKLKILHWKLTEFIASGKLSDVLIIEPNLGIRVVHEGRSPEEKDDQEEYFSLCDSNKFILTPLKGINVVPNETVFTKILITEINPGTNVLKGYEASCEGCGRSKIVYSKAEETCAAVFAHEHKKDGTSGCVEGRGMKHVTFESINDTGYRCVAIDPDDNGSCPQYQEVFFSNSIIPEQKELRLKFETMIQTNPMVVSGVIVPLENKNKQTAWMIDVRNYLFEDQRKEVDKNKLHFFNNTPRDNTFFQKNFIPEVYGKSLQKKIMAINLLSPIFAELPTGEKIICVQNNLEAGDPGQVKTVGFNGILKYCEGVRVAKLISVENSTNRGLIGSVQKNPSTGRYGVKLGELTSCNRGYVGLDGIGKLSQDDMAQLRGIEEEHQYQINKAGKIKGEAIIRIQAMSNLTKPVNQYSSKHQASFDISATTLGQEGKFSGADRRRYHHITIIANEDTSASDIDNHLFLEKNVDGKELIDYWNNLREFACTLDPKKVCWDDEEGLSEDDTIKYAVQKVQSLREKYFNFCQDYGILSKGGCKMFLAQLPGVAILHESIDEEGNVCIHKEHVDWLYNLYLEEFKDLGLNEENSRNDFFNYHANKIIRLAHPEQKEILCLLHRYGSQSAIEKAGIKSHAAIWRSLSEVIQYQVIYEEKEIPAEDWHYSFFQGSGPAKIDFNFKIKIEEPDGVLPPVTKRDGTLTGFGRILIKKAAELEKPKFKGTPKNE